MQLFHRRAKVRRTNGKGNLCIFFLFLRGIAGSLLYRVSWRKGKHIQLPEVDPEKTLSDTEFVTLARRYRKIINTIFFWHPGPCFFRAYTTLFVLRNLGLDVELNFGMVDPHAERLKTIRAHCWLSVAGEPFVEFEDVQSTYPTFLGQHPGGGVFYWARSAEDEVVLKEKP